MATLEGVRMKLVDEAGPVLTGRMRAQALRGELESQVATSGHVVLDFDGVQAVSPSFADEIFVRFVGAVGGQNVTFENLSAHLQRVQITVARHQ